MEEWKKQFLDSLSGPKAKNLIIPQALIIKDQHMPASIYKYRRLNDYSISNLKTNSIWVNSPDEYNDPYDSAITLKHDLLLNAATKIKLDEILGQSEISDIISETDKNIIKNSDNSLQKISEIVLNNDDTIPNNNISEMVMVLQEASKRVFEKHIIEKTNNFIQKGTKISSFSAKNNSIVMWSHYSCDHKGFCVEYDLSDKKLANQTRILLYPVIYSKKFFDATPYFLETFGKEDFNNLFGILAAIHKSLEWEYEDEWRLVMMLGPSEPSYSYRMPKTKSIFLGANIRDEDKKKIVKIGRELGVNLYQAHLSKSEFKLEFEKIKS